MRERFQGSLGLPGRGKTEVVVAIVIRVVVDVQTRCIEVADVDTVAVRIHILFAPVRGTGT